MWEEDGGGDGAEENCDICDINQTLYPTAEKNFMLLSKRYSPETSNF